MRWTIRRLLLVLVLVGAFMAILVGGVGVHNTSTALQTDDELLHQSAALRQAMLADMMHDALRADVLRAIFAARTSPAERDEVLRDVVAHIRTFQEALADSALTHSSDTIQTVLRGLEQPLASYFAAADSSTRLAFRDRGAAERRYPEFQAAFERLEGGMDQLGDAVQFSASRVVARTEARNRSARSTILAVIAFGVVISLLLGRLISGRIVNDVSEIRRVMGLVGAGDFREQAAVTSDNELGETAGALNRTIEGMRSALQSDQVDWRQVGEQRAEVVRIKQLVENAPINIMWADRDLTVRYMNPASLQTFRKLQQHLPVKAEEMVGQSIDHFHRLSDVQRLPHAARIQIGPDTVDLTASAMKDERGELVGTMVTWEVITAKLEAERKVQEAQARELNAAEERRKAERADAERRQLEADAREAEARTRAEQEQRQATELRSKVDQILGVVEYAASGDLTHEITVRGDDAIGRLGEGLSSFFRTLRTSLGNITHTAVTVNGASSQVHAIGQKLGSVAAETSAQATVVAAAADEVSRNVQTVASGTEEMSASIREIAKNASEAARVATQAVKVTERTNRTVAKLGDSSGEIGKVIKVITSIAEQTNLLALNATIEAARAGEAGKGFAVVANEVKELAKETARATEEIGGKIEAIQADTSGAVTAIREISDIIAQINSIQTTIAGAVEEQTATTNEMSRNVSEAARGAEEIARNIQGLAQAAQGTTEGAERSQSASADLARAANDLQQLVGQFRIGGEAAERGTPVVRSGSSLAGAGR
jgi:methyl-accepting chemotaxis protein